MEFRLDDALAILSRTPAVLDALLRDLPDSWTAPNEGSETFSPWDVVGHLIHGEETDWIPRAQIILAHGEARAFAPFDRFGHYQKCKSKLLGELLDTFARLRRQGLETLKQMNLTPEKLALRGTHPALGAVTLAQLLATWTAHDLSHIGQIVRVMSKQYADATGPWKAYMRVFQQ